LSTVRDGRRFAWTLAAGFAAIAAIAALRHRTSAEEFLAGVVIVAFVAGVVIPTRLGPIERGWLAFGHALSRVTTPIFLGVVYFIIVTPTGWIRRRFGRDPIARDRGASTYWVERRRMSGDEIRESFEHLY
jgi:hypothetical protein